MARSISHLDKLVYQINVDRVINQVYFSKYREVTREFVAIEIFRDYILNYGKLLSDSVFAKLFMGFEYLVIGAKEDFSSDYNEDVHVLESPPLSEVSRALFADIIEHFCSELALTLIEETDIYQFINYPIVLSGITSNHVTFLHRRKTCYPISYYQSLLRIL